MSQLNGCQLLEAVGGVDDALIDESLDYFFPASEARTVLIPPARPKHRLTFRLPMAAAMSAAVLCIVLTVLPLAGGMNLWQGLGNFFLTPFAPGETDTSEESEYECEPDSEEVEEPEDETGKDSDSFDPDDDFGGGAQHATGGNPVTFLPSNPGYDPRPEWPTINWDPPRPQTPTVPRPNVPTPGPSPWP